MINPISSNINPADQERAEPIARTEAAPAKKDVPVADVVQLSNAAQAKLLRQQGLSTAEIAVNLGLDEKIVSMFLPSFSMKETKE